MSNSSGDNDNESHQLYEEALNQYAALPERKANEYAEQSTTDMSTVDSISKCLSKKYPGATLPSKTTFKLKRFSLMELNEIKARLEYIESKKKHKSSSETKELIKDIRNVVTSEISWKEDKELIRNEAVERSDTIKRLISWLDIQNNSSGKAEDMPPNDQSWIMAYTTWLDEIAPPN